MKEFFLILFFSKTVLLTPSPVTIDGGTTMPISLSEPVKALTEGANIQVDVTGMFEFRNGDILEIRSIVKEKFSGEKVMAILSNGDNRLELEFKGNTSINNDSVRLVLTTNRFPLEVEFSKLEITSSIKLDNVLVYWKNYTH